MTEPRGPAREPFELESPEPERLVVVVTRHIRNVLVYTGGNKCAAARLLGIDRRTLARKLKKGRVIECQDE